MFLINKGILTKPSTIKQHQKKQQRGMTLFCPIRFHFPRRKPLQLSLNKSVEASFAILLIQLILSKWASSFPVASCELAQTSLKEAAGAEHWQPWGSWGGGTSSLGSTLIEPQASFERLRANLCPIALSLRTQRSLHEIRNPACPPLVWRACPPSLWRACPPSSFLASQLPSLPASSHSSLLTRMLA